jgi:hypothetical protein
MSTAVKSSRPGTARAPRRSSGGGGGFWLLVCLVVLGVGSVFIFAPELPRSLLGLAKAPDRKQESEPTAPENVATGPQGKEHAPDSDLDKTRADTAARNAAKPAPGPAPVVEKPKTFTDEAKAKGYLADAEKAYKAMQWTAASNAAHKIDGLSVTPATSVRAQDIVKGAAALDKLFKELGDDKDELIRYYDTHPSLAVVETNGQPSLAVPIISIDTPTPLDGNPVEIINAQRKTGKINLLIKGKKDFMPASMPADLITKVEPADIAAITKQKQAELDERINRLKNGNDGSNALAWYYAGKFAYRNRLDERVTELMDQAVVLDAQLVKSVREDKAGSLYANVIAHMKNGNQKQADAFMAIIARKYADTDQGKQARLFYEGKTAEMLTAAKEADARQRAAEEERKKQLMERAKTLGDQQAIAKLEKKTPEPQDEPAEPISASTSDSAGADQLYAKGVNVYAHAQQLGATPERNKLYHESEMIFRQAKAIYIKLVEKSPNDEGLQSKMLQCQQLLFGAHKYQTE